MKRNRKKITGVKPVPPILMAGLILMMLSPIIGTIALITWRLDILFWLFIAVMGTFIYGISH